MANGEWSYNWGGTYVSSAATTATSNAAVFYAGASTVDAEVNDYGIYITTGYDTAGYFDGDVTVTGAFAPGSVTLADDTFLDRGSAPDFRSKFDTNSTADAYPIYQTTKSTADDSSAIFYSRDLDPDGDTGHNDYLSPTFVIANDEGADANDYAGVVIGERAQANVAAVHYFDFYAMTGAIDGAVDPTTTEIAPAFRFGDTPAATGHALTSGDVIFNDDIEIDGTTWFDGAASFYGAITFSGSAMGSFRQGADDGLIIAPAATDGFTNNHFILTTGGNAAKDHDHETPSANPTLFIHSNTDPDTANTQWTSLTHNQTDGVIKTGLGNLTIGASADTHTLNTPNDLFVSGKLEIDGATYIDGGLVMYSSLDVLDNIEIRIGSNPDTYLDWSTNQATENTLVWGLGATANSLIFANSAVRNKDFDHAATSNPTLFIHSNTDPDTANTQWLSMTHNQTNGLITTGLGTLDLGTTAASGHSLGAGDVLVGGGLEVDGESYFDSNVYLYGIISFTNITNMGGIRQGTDDGVRMIAGNQDGGGNRHWIFTDGANRDSDHDHDVRSDNPTMFFHSVTDPDVSNNQWGSITHDQENIVISTGANVGTGSVPTTDVNGVSIEPSALTSGGTGDFGLRVTRTLNDSGAAGGSDLFEGLEVDITTTDTTGWNTVRLLSLKDDGAVKLYVNQVGALTTLSGFVMPATTSGYFQSGGGAEGFSFRPITDRGVNLSLGTDGYGNNVMNITTDTNKNADHGQATMLTNPTMRFYSPTNPTTVAQYVSLYQDTTDFYIEAVDQGAVTVDGLDITINAGGAGTGGASAGGDIELIATAANGAASPGQIKIYEDATQYGFINKYPAIARPIIGGVEADGATAIGITIGAGQDYSTGGAKLVSFRDNFQNGTGGVELAYIDYLGGWFGTGGNFSAEVNFTNNAAAATFGAVGTDADVVLAFDAVTAVGSLTYMEDEDRFDFDNDVDVIGDLTAATITSDADVTGATVASITAANLVDKSANEAISGTWDYSGGSILIPNGTTIPGTCAVGQMYQDTNSDDCADTGGGDGALCLCKTTNNWALISNF